ncbi:uncharacterized protein synr [Epargyreus clarus]|uniref:uncharacterized protein synr n=1 Tax=Epargyreus clarus TaxID=520877 RepID=UPI003C30D12F
MVTTKARYTINKHIMSNQDITPWLNTSDKNDTVVSMLRRLDEEIARSEKSYPAERLAVVTAELESIQQEIKEFNERNVLQISTDSYAKTLHQIFVSLDLYNRPMLASENEDFIANVNRKEMRRLELMWLCTRQRELQQEQRLLHAQLLRTRSLYKQLQQLLDSTWSNGSRPGTGIEDALGRAHALRGALASVSARLRAAVEYVHAALRLLDEALPAWKLASVGKSGWERTAACAEACHVLIRARCSERGARRVLAAPAAPRAARALRLALDYAFTDAIHDHKYQRATETFVQFKEALVQLVKSIHQVLLNNRDNLAVAEKEVITYRKQLQVVRVNDIVRRGLADKKYNSAALPNLKTTLE